MEDQKSAQILARVFAAAREDPDARLLVDAFDELHTEGRWRVPALSQAVDAARAELMEQEPS